MNPKLESQTVDNLSEDVQAFSIEELVQLFDLSGSWFTGNGGSGGVPAGVPISDEGQTINLEPYLEE